MTDQPPNLLEALFALRDQQRMDRTRGAQAVRGAEIPWEQNRHGEMKWLMHPLKGGNAVNLLTLFEQRIAPGSCSGRQRHPGGQVIYVRSGTGYTLLDGVKMSWSEGFVLTLPLRRDGVIFQHFNTSDSEPVILVCCEPNMVHALGVDRGSAFEQLADAPDADRPDRT